MGERGKNCDGHEYFPDLSYALKDVLVGKPTYILAMQPKAWNEMRNPIKLWCDAYGVDTSKWPDADVLHNDSMNNKLKDFFEALSDKGVVMVGPSYLTSLKIGKSVHSIFTPEKNAWIAFSWILGNCMSRAESGSNIFLFSCGMMSKVLIDRMHRMYGDGVTLLDTGSVFDYFVGKPSRRYIAQMLKEDENEKEK